MKYLITLLTCISINMAADGKISGVTYFDYTNAEEKSAFNFNRQYFIYGVDVSDDISFKVVFDVGRINNKELYTWSVKGSDSSKVMEDTRLITFLKKAQIDYTTSLGKVSMGLIGTNTYGVQENNWGYRFIEKSAIDKYGFSSTADIGVGFSRSLIDNLIMSIQIINGEGYKKPQGDKYHKISFNTIYGEEKINNNDGYNAGFVYSAEATDSDPVNMMSIFGGFAGMGMTLGAEYDILTKGTIESNIISVSANYTVIDKMDVFVRYDMADDNNDVDKNGNNYLITGIVLKCDGGISVAPNLRKVNYENTEKKSEMEYRVNFQFKF